MAAPALSRDFIAGRMPETGPPDDGDPARGLAIGLVLAIIIWAVIVTPIIWKGI